MRGNGGNFNAARQTAPRAGNVWSTGRIELEAPGHKTIVGSVELFRMVTLVLVAARFDTDDAAFLSSDLFPLCFSTVERWPDLSLAAEPLAELGVQVTQFVIGKVQTELQQWEEKTRAVSDAMAELAQTSEQRDASIGEALHPKPPEVS